MATSQVVFEHLEEIVDREIAKKLGLHPDEVFDLPTCIPPELPLELLLEATNLSEGISKWWPR